MTERPNRRGSKGAEEQGSLSSRLLPTSSVLLLIVLILLFATFFSLLAVQQHRTFLTNGLDLGNVDQALWNTAQGQFLHFTLMTSVQSRLALHVEPVLLLFVPFYWLGLGGPEFLLIIQASVVALGAWPLYQITRNQFCGEPRHRSPLLPYPHMRYLKQSKTFPVTTRPPSIPPSRGEVSSSPSQGEVGRGSNVAKIQPQSLKLMRMPPCSPAHLLIFPLAYLLLPTLQSAVLFDFHAVTLASTFLLFAFLALERRNNRRFIVFIVLVMACKEDMPLVVAMLGLYAGLVQRRWRLAGLTIGLSAVWFIIAFFVIQPYFAAGGNIQLDRYAWLGDNPLEMLQTLITQPEMVFDHLWHQADLPGYLTALFFPTAFLAVLNPFTLAPMLPSLAVNLLSNNPFTWRLEDFHYGAPLAPFLFISAVYGIGRISRWAGHQRTKQSPNPSTVSKAALRTSLPISQAIDRKRRDAQAGFTNYQLLITLLSLLLLIFSAIYHYHRGFTPLSRPFLWPASTAHHQQLESVLATIPANTPLFTQSNLAPHLTQRQTIYSDFAYFTDPDYPAPEKVEDIVLDITTFENIGGLHQFLQTELVESGNYQLITAQDGILHLKPVTTTDQPGQQTLSNPPVPTPHSGERSAFELPTSFFSFTNPDPPPNHPLQVDFGDTLRLHGYTLHFNRQEEIEITVDMEALKPLDSIQPVLYLLDAQGRPVGATTDLQPTLVWHPVERWQVGQIVRVRFNTLPWYTRETPAYRLALGVVSGSDVWEGIRHHPSVSQSTNLAVRLPAGGTLVELAYIEQVWKIPQGGPQLRQFDRPISPNTLQANFSNQIELLGYTPPKISNPESPYLSITLAWQAITTPDPFIRFVQLIGPDGQVYGQQDSAPDFGNYPTSLWQAEEVVVETVMFPIPAERPAGQFILHIGLYHPDSGERLLLTSGGDHVEIPVVD